MILVFLTFHGISHFHASFRIARALSKTYTIIYAGFPSFRKYVESQGFRYYPLASVPFGLGFEEWVNEQEKANSPWFASLRDRWSGRLFSHRNQELKTLINELDPAFIFVDAQQPTDFVVLYPYAKSRQIKLAILHTMLPHVLRKGYPPGNSLSIPGNDKAFFVTAAYRWRRAFRKMITLVKYFGKTNESMVRSIMKANGTPLHYLSRSVSHLSVHINGPDEFILAPCEFDFSSSARSKYEHYVGFMPDNHRREFIGQKVADLFSHVEHTRLPLVYCSLGTVSGNDGKTICNFLKRFIEAVAGQPLIAAISTMATGEGGFQIDLPPNVFSFNPAPQLALLNRASAFITHGGINSIKEAVHAGVPMVVYPRDRRQDQNGNAARVVFNQLGLVGDIRRDTAGDIFSKVTELLENPIYRRKVREFKALDSTYTEDQFKELFDRIKPLD